MRVLHVINDLRVGGAETLLENLAPRLRASGVDLEVAALRPAQTFVAEAIRTSGVPLTEGAAGDGFYSVRHIARLAERMRSFDIVHSHLFPAQLWTAWAARLLPKGERPRLVTSEHNAYNRRRAKPYLRPVDAAMYAAYDRIVAVSQPTADALAAWVPKTAAKTTVITTAVDVERFAFATPASKTDTLGVPPETLVAVCVGRLETQKDHKTLLDALPLLPGVHLALVGDGDLRPQLEAQAARLGIADRTRFLGRRSDVPALLAMADVYIQPSLWEGWCISVLEAMASGRAPLVASDAPGLKEAVGDGRGLLFPAGDAAALARSVLRLLTEKTLTNNCRTAAAAYVEGFRMEACVAAHTALYEELFSRPKG